MIHKISNDGIIYVDRKDMFMVSICLIQIIKEFEITTIMDTISKQWAVLTKLCLRQSRDSD